MILKLFVLGHKEFDCDRFDPSYMVKLFNYQCHNKYDHFKDHFLYETYMIYDVYEHLDQYIDKDTQYIGFCHYRRYFDTDYDTLLNHLQNNKSILLQQENWGNVKIQYNSYHDKSNTDLNLIGYIINKKYPEYQITYNNFINRSYISPCNMFITSIDIFKQYIEWVFDIIDEYCKYHNFSDYKDAYKFVIEHSERFKNLNIANPQDQFNTIEYNARLGGFIIERLLTVYFLQNYKDNLIYIPKCFIK